MAAAGTSLHVRKPIGIIGDLCDFPIFYVGDERATGTAVFIA
jgi:hypothetical protein